MKAVQLGTGTMNWTIFNESLNRILHVQSKTHAFELVERCAKHLGCRGLFVLHLVPGKTVRGKTRIEISTPHERVSRLLERMRIELLSKALEPIYEATQPTHVTDAASFLRARKLLRLAHLATITQSDSLLIIPVTSRAEGAYCFVFVGQRIPNTYTSAAALSTLAHITIESQIADSSYRKALPENILSQREVECFRLLVMGKDDPEIASIVGISERTVRYHLDGARAKLGARNRAHVVAMVVGERLLEI